MQVGETSVPAIVRLVSEISRINVALPLARGNSENRSIEVICFEGIIVTSERWSPAKTKSRPNNNAKMTNYQCHFNLH